jgi:hypothetical protein
MLDHTAPLDNCGGVGPVLCHFSGVVSLRIFGLSKIITGTTTNIRSGTPLLVLQDMFCLFYKVGLSDQCPQPFLHEGKIQALPINRTHQHLWGRLRKSLHHLSRYRGNPGLFRLKISCISVLVDKKDYENYIPVHKFLHNHASVHRYTPSYRDSF